MIPTSLKLSDSKFIRYFKSFVLLQKKVDGFYGNFGHGDLGDDASFYAAQKVFGEKLLPFSKRSYAFNPRVLNSLLIGGGGNLRWECPYIPNKLLKKEKWDFPIILFAAGVNCDYDVQFSDETKDKLTQLCGMCRYITVRDYLSTDFIKDLGFDDVHLLPDMELLLDEQRKEFHYEKKGFTVGMVLTPHSVFSKDTFQNIADAFVAFTDYLTDNGMNVLFLPFEQSHSENKREEALIGDIISRVKVKSQVSVLKDEVTPQEMLHAIKKNCDAMVCMRLHSAVFAVNAGVPFLCVSFNQMHKGFMELIELPELEVSLFEDFSHHILINKFEYLTDDLDGFKAKIIEKRDILRDQMVKQLKIIKGMIPA